MIYGFHKKIENIGKNTEVSRSFGVVNGIIHGVQNNTVYFDKLLLKGPGKED